MSPEERALDFCAPDNCSGVLCPCREAVLDALRSAQSQARDEALEEAIAAVRKEADAMLGDIVPGDDIGARLHKHAAGVLLTVTQDIAALKASKP
jgi:hypothetical protein